MSTPVLQSLLADLTFLEKIHTSPHLSTFLITITLAASCYKETEREQAELIAMIHELLSRRVDT